MIHLSNPLLWREDHVCSYQISKGHNTKIYFKLKDVIQDLMDARKVVTDGPVKKLDHKAFKQPLQEYEKVQSSKIHEKNHDEKINYTYANIDNVINMIEPIEYLCMMGPNSDKESNYDTNKERQKVVLKM